jgi:hypothetical protein
MVEAHRMTVADVVAQVGDGRLEDFVREAVLVAREVMEAEISGEVGAALGEVSQARSTYRNGYRPRPWETRVGEIELMIPRKREGPAYFPSFLEPRRRSEQAIVAVVLEAYVNGVSTRKVDRLVEQLGIEGMTKDRVSALCRGLDEQVELFRQRPLEGAYPYLWLDAKHVKVRDHGRVVSKALVVAYAVHETGVREVIGLDIGEVESGSFWVEFLRSLKKRGLTGVRLAVSDQPEGLKHAIARVLGCSWQRCTVHFVRDMLAHCRRAGQRAVVGAKDQARSIDQQPLAGHPRTILPRPPRRPASRRARAARRAQANGRSPGRPWPPPGANGSSPVDSIRVIDCASGPGTRSSQHQPRRPLTGRTRSRPQGSQTMAWSPKHARAWVKSASESNRAGRPVGSPSGPNFSPSWRRADSRAKAKPDGGRALGDTSGFAGRVAAVGHAANRCGAAESGGVCDQGLGPGAISAPSSVSWSNVRTPTSP